MSASTSTLGKTPFRARAPPAGKYVVDDLLPLNCGTHDAGLADSGAQLPLRRQVNYHR